MATTDKPPANDSTPPATPAHPLPNFGAEHGDMFRACMRMAHALHHDGLVNKDTAAAKEFVRELRKAAPGWHDKNGVPQLG